MAGIHAIAGSKRAAAAVLQLIASEYSSEATSPAAAVSSFSLNTSGAATGGDTVISGSGSYNWRVGGVSSDYEVVVTLSSGTFSSGATGVSALSSTRTWNVNRSTVGSKSVTATFLIRLAGGGATIVPATSITMTAIGTL